MSAHVAVNLDHPVAGDGQDRDETPTGPSAVALAVAGAGAVATAFGMARYGYGLLLPDIKADLVLGATALGAIGTLGYVAYVLAALVVGPSVARLGERGTVVAGGLLAVAGTVVIALAPGPAVLALGVAVAGASCGIVYPPFADAVARLPAAVRDRTLATINCGTGWGVAVAAPIAIVAGDGWRLAYVGFALCALASTVAAARVLPGRPTVARTPDTPPSHPHNGVVEVDHAYGGQPRPPRVGSGVRWRVGRVPAEARRLLAGAVVFGLGSAAYWTFAVDHVRDAGGLDTTTARVMLGLAGVGSLLGATAGDVVHRLGARATFTGAAALTAAALTTVALAPAHPAAVFAAAIVFGAGYNSVVAVQALESGRAFEGRASTGLALAMGANAVGLLWGPLAGGAVTDAVGSTTALLGAAALILAATLLAPHRTAPPDAAP